MAKIWPVYEGGESKIGGPWADLPVSEAISLFDLKSKDLVSDSTTTPRFGNAKRDLSYLGFKHIVVEIDHDEGRRAKWKPGFYRSPVSPKEAFRRLIQRALVTELGQDNVVCVRCEPTISSEGQDALKITVVITPDATQKLAEEAALNALVRLQEQLNEMQDDRTPIIEYATKAELAQDGAR